MPCRIPGEAHAPTRALLEWVEESNPPPLHGMNPQEARRAFDERRERVELAPEPVAETRDLAIDSAAGPIPARLYTPAGGAAPRPLALYFHGGGFVIGNLESHDSLCRRLANRAGCLVLSVDYRLAPEHP